MTGRPVQVVTFDLWDCMFVDDTDEPKRAAAGVPPKPVARRRLVHDALNRHAPIPQETVDLAYDVADAAFNEVWHEQHVTWSVHDRLSVLLAGLKRELPDDELAELVRLHEEMELEFRPDPAPGLHDALRELHGRFPLAVVSDAIFSPGRCLRELLRGEGLLDYFGCCAFSDEIGRSKPDPAMYQSVADHFGATFDGIVHVGDRPHNDIGGAHAIGARGVLLTVVKQRPLEGHAPDAVCSDYAGLPAIITTMNS